MTYISRKTRIILSRGTDECGSDYILRAVRKRSDGRFKRHSSCEDLRAWVNDYCVNHEHLVDLMSDGEFSGQPPYRLYGRFIPVPILMEIMLNLRNGVDCGDQSENQRKNSLAALRGSVHDKCTCIESSDWSRNTTRNLGKNTSSSRIEWEKGCLEKSLYESTNLLCRALATLEKIENIVDLTKQESENARNEEIELAFSESHVVCPCDNPRTEEDGDVPAVLHSSRSQLKKMQDSTKCTELLRKISGLREKLKKIQECRETVTREIHMSEMKATECESPKQVTELYNFREQCHVKKLKKKLEKLISEKGRLLSEMCNALNSLNALKKSSRSSLPRLQSSGVSRNDVTQGGQDVCANCDCGCEYSDNYEKCNYESPSEGFYCNECAKNSKMAPPCNSTRSFIVEITSDRSAENSRTKSSDTICLCDESTAPPCFYNEPATNANPQNTVQPCPTQIFQPTKNTPKKPTISKTSKPSCLAKEHREPKRQSRISFADENESPCRKKFYQDNLAAYEKSVTAEQKAVIEGALKKIEKRRSQLFNTQTGRRSKSSPTTQREKKTISFENCYSGGYQRRVRSETNMQEIEKTLRNYEQRLKCYDDLECKIEEIRQKVLEANRIKREWGKQKEQGQKMIQVEREHSCREISRLSSENKVLKKQIQQLMAKFDWQCKKIHSLKATARKNWELECETEELKKEMMKYQDTMDHQRKCINKWESVVTLQRKEIENLVNHIRQLTTASTPPIECPPPPPERRDIQRSRSFSPHVMRPQIMFNRVKTRGKSYESSSEEDCGSCYPEGFEVLENQQENYEDPCYSPVSGRRMNW